MECHHEKVWKRFTCNKTDIRIPKQKIEAICKQKKAMQETKKKNETGPVRC